MEQQELRRYRCRAGVMSRNEGGEKEELFVWRVFFFEKAYSSSRVTVVRDGMSGCEVLSDRKYPPE